MHASRQTGKKKPAVFVPYPMGQVFPLCPVCIERVTQVAMGERGQILVIGASRTSARSGLTFQCVFLLDLIVSLIYIQIHAHHVLIIKRVWQKWNKLIQSKELQRQYKANFWKSIEKIEVINLVVVLIGVYYISCQIVWSIFYL